MLLPRVFWDKVDATGDCWIWTAARSAYGHGQWNGTKRWRERYPNSTKMVHRLVWLALVGSIPEGKVMDHLCRNPPCVNPDHLQVVTQALNIQRGQRIGRPPKADCLKGHPLSGDNLYVKPDGERRCRICQRESGRKQAAKRAAGKTVPDRPLLTQCKRGHLYDDTNTYIDPKGRRHCKACRRIASRKLYQRNLPTPS